MVKAQKSAGRRSAHSHRPQSGDQMETEEDRPQQEPQQQQQQQQQQQEQQEQQEDEDHVAPPAPSTPAHSPTPAKGAPPPLQPPPCGDPETSPQHDRSPQCQNKPLWKPIPPLVPESLSHTRDQSCQTEESCTGNHGQNTGGCVEPGDPPLLQQPLQTSKSGIQQIIECFRSGTSQLKHMLLREVDTIFECKLCRSLFRGLPNLITHKEYYCLSQLPEPDGPPGDDRQSVAMKDLLDAIYPRSDRSDYVVRLEPIQTTNKAVFQYIATEEELARYPSHTTSARESPVAWEGEAVESADNNQPSQPGGGGAGGAEGHSSPAANQAARRWEAEEEPKDEQTAHEDEGSTSGVDDVTISCCLCGQDFNSRRSIRRHCRKMHQTKLEELRKFTETRTVPTSLLSMVKGRPKTLSSPTGKFCPVCLKTFATKANVRRHFDEVHRGLRRDNMAPGAATRPGQLFLEATPPKKNHSSSSNGGGGGASSSSNASPTRSHATKSTAASSKTQPAQNQTKTQTQPQSTTATTAAAASASTPACRCTLCKRNYSSQLMLKRHMRIVHKVYSVKSNRSAPAPSSSAPAGSNSSGGNTTSAGPSNNVRVKEEAAESSDDDDDEEEEEEEEEMDSSPAPSPSGSSSATNKSAPPAAAATGSSHKVKEEEPPSSPKTSSRSAATAAATSAAAAAAAASPKMNKLSVGFDFTQLFCKLCKRQFSSRQNLTKHIELHTDGNDIFIKFYRCPLCRYESRRKRDVLRHVTVVHKKSSSYLAKIMPKLESRAVKRLAEVVLNSANTGNKRTGGGGSNGGGGGGGKEEVNGRQASSSSSSSSSPSPPVTRKQQDCSSGPAPSSSTSSSSTTTQPPPVTRKHQEASSTPAAAATAASTPPVTRKQERHQSHQRRATSPPLTRRSEKHMHQRNSFSSSASSSAATPNTRRHDADSGSTGSTSTEVRVTKNFSLHACDQCGRAFAKKLYLESHKRSHRNTPTNKRKGVSTRSKSLAW